MDSVDIEVLRTAVAWRKQGRHVALGTIVKTWGSARASARSWFASRAVRMVAWCTCSSCERTS